MFTKISRTSVLGGSWGEEIKREGSRRKRMYLITMYSSERGSMPRDHGHSETRRRAKFEPRRMLLLRCCSSLLLHT